MNTVIGCLKDRELSGSMLILKYELHLIKVGNRHIDIFCPFVFVLEERSSTKMLVSYKR